MVDYHSFYGGTNYGLNPDDGSFIGVEYRPSASNFALTTRPDTANQVKEVSEKLNTGVKAIEITAIIPSVLESIPEQHLEEINRLRKLSGVDFTFHGPLVEPTGIDARSMNWDENRRVHAERQIYSSVERAHKVKPDGNIVVTFHTTGQEMIPEPESKELVKKGGKEEEITTGLWVINERTGQVGGLPKPKEDYLLGEKRNPDAELKRINQESWSQSLSGIAFEAKRAEDILNPRLNEDLEKVKIGNKTPQELYVLANTKEGREFIEKKLTPKEKEWANVMINNMVYGDTYLKDSYRQFKELYNQAYFTTEENSIDREKLDKLKKEIAPVVKSYQDGDRSKIIETSEAIREGIKVLDSITPPEAYKPIKQFLIDKSSETFANVAFDAYKKFGDSAPIISIENPPAGAGINRAEDLKKLIEETREKFVDRAIKEKNISEAEAKKQAEKLIGATWDVGHINMIRKFGYGEKDVVKETETIAPYIKNVHLSDNFGLEHTELPMGMGNVPTKEHMKLIEKFNKQAKKVIETGQWYQHFQTSPLVETLQAFGSPIYGMKMAPYWNQNAWTVGGYFAGYGTNPDIHHSIYGSGFSNLPVELGGQTSGRSRASGAPIE